MGRPSKNRVDYFSHDSDASRRRTLTILFNHFGHEGISAWWQLLETLSDSENHVIDIRNPEDAEFLAANMRFPLERLQQILGKIADLNAIDPKLYEFGLIWSDNLVERLADVYKRRKQELPSRPVYMLTKKQLMSTETELMSTESTQSKVKESKGNNKDFVLPDFIEKETWNDYLEMRVRIKKPATIKAQELAIKELEKLSAAGHDPNEVLRQSIMNSWQGVFPLRDKGRGNGANKNSPVARGVKAHGEYTRPEDI